MTRAEGIRILLVEDSPQDAELFRIALQSAQLKCHIVRVDTAAAFSKALNDDFDLIVSDFSLPTFDGKKAFTMAGERRPELPFIFVSGTLGEDAAIECLVAGATDYVLKHKFGRLVPAVQRALTEREERTARHEAERKLAEALAQLKNLFDNLDEVFFSFDPRVGQLLQISPACERIFGHARDSFFGDPAFWITAAIPEDRPTIKAAQTALRSGQTASCEYRIRRADGALRWVSVKLKPVLAADGQIFRVDGILSDVHEKKELESTLLRAQRMESIGSLAGGIAHDLNNVLSPILMGVQLMRSRLVDSSNLSILTTIEACAVRGANLVKQILMFGRGVEGRRTSVDFGRLIRALNNMLQRTFPKSIKIEIDTVPNLWQGSADSTQIEQVLMNLLVNARDAMPQGGLLRITARNLKVDGAAFVEIAVKDTWVGIAPENLDRIFEPFFTTKPVGVGTGLGLSTSNAIVKSHGGSISVDSGSDGTTFGVRLPAVSRKPSGSMGAKALEFPAGNNELILFVDDELGIRDFAKMILESYGYRVLTAADGAAACDIYAGQSSRIDLVITDMNMPGMDGVQLIQALDRINPNVRVVLVTGVIDRPSLAKEPTKPVVSIIEKPFTPTQLLQTLKTVLRRTGGKNP